jgi:hypothetical protein
MTILGILLILFAITMAVVINMVTIRKEPVTDERFGRTIPASPKFLREWTMKKSLLVGLVGILFTTASSAFFYNPAGTATSVQYLWGGDDAVTTQGLKMKLWGKTIPISFEIAMQDVILETNEEGVRETLPSEDGIYYREGQRREFADAIKADIAASLVISVDYQNEELFLDMADKNRSEEKLVYARIYPVYDQALKNTCKLMDAQDYISGAAPQFDYYLKDQMENGMYLTEESYEEVEEELITVSQPDDSTSTSNNTRTVAKGKVNKEKRQKKYKIRRYPGGHAKAGEPIRDASNSLKRYGLTVQQAAVTNIDWEASFDKRLQLQKEQVAQTQLEKQEAEKEYYATQKAVAKGEREKAEVRVKYEKQQLEKTISAETRAKEAKYKEQEEINLLAAEKKRAQRIRVAADADAYEISKKVHAGITPEVRLKMELDAKVKMMKALAGPDGIVLPKTMFTGEKGGNGQSGMLESILGAKILSGELGAQK